jgi:hypothetical protein
MVEKMEEKPYWKLTFELYKDSETSKRIVITNNNKKYVIPFYFSDNDNIFYRTIILISRLNQISEEVLKAVNLLNETPLSNAEKSVNKTYLKNLRNDIVTEVASIITILDFIIPENYFNNDGG